MGESVGIALECYMKAQSLENFLRFCDAVASSPGYLPYSETFKGKAFDFMEKDKFEEAKHIRTLF